MKPIEFHDLRQLLSATPLTPAPTKPLHVTGVCTDSRLISPGALFIALKGETLDGHDYLAVAAEKGAAAALVERASPPPPPNFPVLAIESTRHAMGRLARHVRDRFNGRVISVSGSNGKTGTKNLIDSLLNRRLKGSISPKSFNNDIGVPVTIFAADPNQHYLVLEIGTNHHGEIRALASVARPDIAVITNVSEEHLEGLGDMAGVRREEASIVEGLKPDGVLIVHGDDPDLLDSVAGYSGKKVIFGLAPTNNLFATDVQCRRDGVTFRLNARREVFVPLLGRHIALNALAAIAVARRMGLSDEEIIANLAHAHGPDMRLQLQEMNGITLLNDAYNANPASTRAALDTLVSLPAESRRIAILGDMRELGDSSDYHHRQVGQWFATHREQIDTLICVGPQAALIADAAQSAGFPAPHITHLADTPTAAATLATWFRPGDLVLLKASRSMRFELIAKKLATPIEHRAAS